VCPFFRLAKSLNSPTCSKWLNCSLSIPLWGDMKSLTDNKHTQHWRTIT
jgi:hypothetical protein